MTRTANKSSGNAGWAAAPAGVLTTGIGSLPHHNVDAALEYAFGVSVPFLPQIPIRNSREFMLLQALDGLPGISSTGEGMPTLDLRAWKEGSAAFRAKLDGAFARAAESDTAFDTFEPTQESYSCWKPFLWEVTERALPMVKIQLAGPLTSQWALRTDEPELSQPGSRELALSTQIFRLIIARSIAMIRRVKRTGAQPLFLLDEPGLFAYTSTNPRHLLALQELKLAVRALQKEGALVGLHCCSNTDWPAVFGLGLDALSFDTHLSLSSVLSHREEVTAFLMSGARFIFGVIPTGRDAGDFSKHDARAFYEEFQAKVQEAGLGSAIEAKLLRGSIYTPACGLALLKTEDTENLRRTLAEFVSYIEA